MFNIKILPAPNVSGTLPDIAIDVVKYLLANIS
jgi:hypothetical protein